MICCPFQTFWLVLPGSLKFLTSTAPGKMACTLLLPITIHNITSMNNLQCKITRTRSTQNKNYIQIYYWYFTMRNHVFCEPVVKDSFFLLHRTNCKGCNFSSCFFKLLRRTPNLKIFIYCSNHWIIITITQQNLFFVCLFLNWQNFEKLNLKLRNLIF
jgi:hypothetical protein